MTSMHIIKEVHYVTNLSESVGFIIYSCHSLAATGDMVAGKKVGNK